MPVVAEYLPPRLKGRGSANSQNVWAGTHTTDPMRRDLL